MANNSHGSYNELEIVNYLNGKKYKELNLSMKEFIKYICDTKCISYNNDTTILCEYVKNNKLKQDMYIIIDDNKYGISLKMGIGNSCHQEKIEDFIRFIKVSCSATDDICDLWRFFIWADGTLDGSGSKEKDNTGKIISRFDSNGFKKTYPEKRILLQEFLDKNKSQLIERALFIGKHNSDVDFIYHGTYKQGRWISKNEVINFLTKQSPKSNRACLTIGSLTVQAWNVSLRGNTEHKRGEIQLKYGTMKEDFDIIMKDHAKLIGTFLGDSEEYDLTQLLNKNKNSPLWKKILPNINNFSDYYLVKVSSNQFSKLSNKIVKTKSDAYVIKAKISKEFLLKKEYILDEFDIEEFSYQIVKDTGISIKMKSSKNFTYQKFTIKSFCKAFSDIDNIEFWLTSLLIYSSDKERYKNEKIISDLGNSFDEYLEKVEQIMKLPVSDINSKSFWDSIRRIAQNKIKDYIQSNNILSESIFTGKHWFDFPYHADFIYESGKLKKNEITSFSITTGSGRSRGKYTIEIIPT